MGSPRRLTLAATAALALAPAAVHAAAAAPPAPLCPTRALASVARNAWAPARHELLPAGASVLRLCRFTMTGAAGLPGATGSREITDGGRIARLAHDLDALPPFPRQALPCPLDNGAQIDVLAAYPGGRRVTVLYETTGCDRVSNGDVVRIASGYHAEALAARLRRELTGGTWILLR